MARLRLRRVPRVVTYHVIVTITPPLLQLTSNTLPKSTISFAAFPHITLLVHCSLFLSLNRLIALYSAAHASLNSIQSSSGCRCGVRVEEVT
jgi:hypothetical protein